jgi:hypothetical protein
MQIVSIFFVNPKLRWQDKNKPHSQGIYKEIYTWQVILRTKKWNNNPRLTSLDGKMCTTIHTTLKEIRKFIAK